MENQQMIISSPRLEDIPELIHRIQSLLPAKEAARTCVLNKSWLHAWSIIPTLRFPRAAYSFTEEQKRHYYMNVVEATLLRYFRDNIAINRVDLEIHINNQELASLVKKWIRNIVVTRSCLRELSLTITGDASFYALPDEILSGENLNTLSVTTSRWKPVYLSISNINTMIKSVSLRVLELYVISISDKVLNKILSTCSLLEKIHLSYCKGFRTIKLKNLCRLLELTIYSIQENEMLEIEGVPVLRSFVYSRIKTIRKPPPFSMDSLASIKELHVCGVIMDHAFFDKINSNFHRLESLTVDMKHRTLEKVNVTCPSLKIFTLNSSVNTLTSVRVYAPKLVLFKYNGTTMPSLVFTTIEPEQMDVVLKISLSHPVDQFLFLLMWETFNLSGKIIIHISVGICDINNVDALRMMVQFPATNVQEAWLSVYHCEALCEGYSRVLDALFTICRPKYVVICNFMYKLMMDYNERNRCWADGDLNCVGVKRPDDKEWRSSTDGSIVPSDLNLLKFKLNWK